MIVVGRLMMGKMKTTPDALGLLWQTIQLGSSAV